MNVEPFCQGLFAKTLRNVNIRSLICNVGAGGPAPAANAAPQEVLLFPPLLPLAVKKVEAKKGESEESDDNVGFGLFHYASSVLFNKKLNSLKKKKTKNMEARKDICNPCICQKKKQLKPSYPEYI